jgi:hypothetical protein
MAELSAVLEALNGKTDVMGTMIRDGMPRPAGTEMWTYLDLPWVPQAVFDGMFWPIRDQVRLIAASRMDGRTRGQFLVDPAAILTLKAYVKEHADG